jgi:hypothetical protein
MGSRCDRVVIGVFAQLRGLEPWQSTDAVTVLLQVFRVYSESIQIDRAALISESTRCDLTSSPNLAFRDPRGVRFLQ